MAITVNTKPPIAITVSSVGSGNSPYAKEHNPHRGGGGGHFAPASTGKFVSNEERLEKENERLREALKKSVEICEVVVNEKLSWSIKMVLMKENISATRATLKEGE